MNDLFEKPDLAALTSRQLLESIYTMLSHRPAQKTPKKRIQGVPKRRHVYPPEFEALWKAYPSRNGSNPKWQAQQAWNARVKESELSAHECQILMLGGVRRYAAWCEATGKTGTELVMRAVRFVGTSREYENPWDCPAPEAIKIPTEINALVKFADGLGIEARPGESTYDFRQRVENSI